MGGDNNTVLCQKTFKYGKPNCLDIWEDPDLIDLGKKKTRTLVTIPVALIGFNFTQYLTALLPRPVAQDEPILMFALSYFNKLTDLVAKTDKRYLINCEDLFPLTLSQKCDFFHGLVSFL